MVVWASKEVNGAPIVFCVQCGADDTEPESEGVMSEEYSDVPMTIWITDFESCWSTEYLPDDLTVSADSTLEGPVPYSWYHFQKTFLRSFQPRNITCNYPTPTSQTSVCTISVELSFDGITPTLWKPLLRPVPSSSIKTLNLLLVHCYLLTSKRVSEYQNGSSNNINSSDENDASSGDSIAEHEDHVRPPEHASPHHKFRRRKERAAAAWQQQERPSSPSPDKSGRFVRQHLVQSSQPIAIRQKKMPKIQAVGKVVFPSPRKNQKGLLPSVRKKPWTSASDDEVLRPVISPPPTPPKPPVRMSGRTGPRQRSKRESLTVQLSGFTGKSPVQQPLTPMWEPQQPPTPQNLAAKSPSSTFQFSGQIGTIKNPTTCKMLDLVTSLFPECPIAARLNLARFDTWDFDSIALLRDLDRPLFTVGYLAFHRFGIIDSFNLDTAKVQAFLTRVEDQYSENPYHNSSHAADVTQALFMLLTTVMNEVSYFNIRPIDKLAAVIAAIGHDVGHPGWNNYLEKAMKTERSMVYNDLSILENFHSSTLFRTLEENDCNFLCDLPAQQISLIRTTVVSMILATDMAQSSKFIYKAQTMLKSVGTENPPSEDEMRKIALILSLKCADVSNPARPTDIAIQWADCIMDEFLCQGDKERLLGIPITKYMDRTEHSDDMMQKCQVGFIAFVVEPLFKVMASVISVGKEECNALEDVFESLKKNRSYWEGDDSQQLASDSKKKWRVSLPAPLKG
eukprot:TRINITY_DN12814_c0_g1_i1.p1 TRINITY_DN12814_c0_g1~~TRINITY_DN12814_c0_g1_i1.p1  ORF type:complete len:736 (+),score=158.54 TRINITY_DN12814_c0_g1_i1:45-2252(+)